MSHLDKSQALHFDVDLDACVDDLSIANFSPSNYNSYHHVDSMIVYDGMGVSHELQSYFVKVSDNQWAVFVFKDALNTMNANSIEPPFIPNGMLCFPADKGRAGPTFTQTDLSALMTKIDTKTLDIKYHKSQIQLNLSAATQHYCTDLSLAVSKVVGLLPD